MIANIVRICHYQKARQCFFGMGKGRNLPNLTVKNKGCERKPLGDFLSTHCMPVLYSSYANIRIPH